MEIVRRSTMFAPTLEKCIKCVCIGALYYFLNINDNIVSYKETGSL